MTTISIQFTGVAVHLKQSENPHLPVPYRVIAPASREQVLLPGPISVDLGTLNPTLQINGGLMRVPCVLTIGGRQAGSPALPDERVAPHLRPLAPDTFLPDDARAYARFPTDGSIYVDIAIPGEFTAGTDSLTFTGTADELLIGLQTAVAGPVERIHLPAAIVIANDAMDTSSDSAEEKTLLGFIALAPAIPARERMRTLLSRSRRSAGLSARNWPFGCLGADPGQPGCSNSQWP